MGVLVRVLVAGWLVTRGTADDDQPASAAGRFPLVVFAHGCDISVADYAGFLRDLVAQGFVIVALFAGFLRARLVDPATLAQVTDRASRDGLRVAASS